MNKAPILSSKDIFDWLEKNNPMGDSSDADRYIQRDADHEYYMKLIKEIELECEARLKEQSVIHSMQLEQVRKETAEQIFKELEKRFGLFVDRKLEKLVIDDSNYYSIGKMEWYKAIKSKYGITE